MRPEQTLITKGGATPPQNPRTMEENKERTRKQRKNGERTQKLMTFRLDNDLCEWLSTKANKGRLINELLQARMMSETETEDCADMPTEKEDYEK